MARARRRSRAGVDPGYNGTVMDLADDRLDLLLADGDEGRPVLAEGLPSSALEGAPRPRKSRDPDEKPGLAPYGVALNDLPRQRWAVVAVQGREGDRQLEAIHDLLALREREQGVAPPIYRVPAEMNAADALAWKQEVYAPDTLPDEDRPHYLLMLGDLDHTPLELQHTLAAGALVGRLHVGDAAGGSDLAGYAAYAEKVARHAGRAAAAAAPDLLYYVAADGSQATSSAACYLIDPSLAESRRLHAKGKLDAASVGALDARTVDELLAAGAGQRPAVLLSASHGLGAPRRGWASPEAQWHRQGAMVIRPGEILDAERLRGQPFLPGGVWFYLACLGAGTPATSAYLGWLRDLASQGCAGRAEAVLESLPQPGDRPFLAALPQAALANPDGPLAVIGHIDLAWTYGFTGATFFESRKSRFLEPLKLLVGGDRVGVALDRLMVSYREANDALTRSYQAQKDAEAAGSPAPPATAERARLWMLRNDLRGYVLLGDPAARLPLQRNAPAPGGPGATPEVRSAPTAGPALASALPAVAAAPFVVALLRGDEAPREIAARAGVPLDTLWEQASAVLALLRGDEAPRAIAARAGVPLDTLWAWVDAYRAERRAERGGSSPA
jgi:hypothetical protein